MIDAIFGTGLAQKPREPFGDLVDAIAETENDVLAIDVPSGLDCDTGQPLGPCVRATRTVTFVAEKAGFANPNSRQYTGEITVAGIGCPIEIIEHVRRTTTPAR
jgi:NAD(P)H-hydrate epimerase